MYVSVNAALRRFAEDQNGASTIEYGLLASLFVVICFAVIQTFGESLDSVHGDVADALTEATDDG